ncbi:hypothetical protein HPB51_025631 [Rhipicephalus microplus]|uniref:BRCT domain-containing protein n=1 Tax=Rhipicephalus microplus TaxID=6941 RepID=A0A9J6F988_RHIMP|nr:hypothetical protein HPB51_025631 [Rhipicephalus microplus]
MGVFDGSVAWFSDTVKDKYKLLWQTHGGTIGDAGEASYLFSNSTDASDVQAVHRRLRNQEHVFLCPRFIIRCVLLGSRSVPTKDHILQGKPHVPRESRSKQTQVTQDNFVPTAGPSKPPEAICITDMSCKNFRIHLKPNASLKIRELFRKKLLKDDSEPECKKKKTQE